MNNVQEFFDDLQNFAVENTPNVITAILILIIGFKVASYASAILIKINEKKNILDSMLVGIGAKLLRTTIIAFTIIAVLDRFDVNISALLAIIGAAGLAIGLALQGSLSNLAAGIIITILQPFKAGDYVNADGVDGSVIEIGIFMSKFRTPDGIDILVPNSRITANKIKNYDSTKDRRTSINIGVGYGEDIDRVFGILNKILENDHRTIKEKPVGIKIVSLDSSQVTLQIRAWVENKHFWDYNFDMVKLCLATLQKNNVEIPFPQIVLHQAEKKESETSKTIQ